MRPDRVAVTGATGQVGAALVQRLHEEGAHVVAATRNALGAALVHASVPDCDIRVGGLARSDGKHLLDDCDVILNCAIASSGANPRQAYARNRALVDGLLEARSLRWLIHFSTVAVFGELIREHGDEQHAFEHPRPDSEYGRSKLDVERYAIAQSHKRGIQVTILRLGHVYGAGIGRSREIVALSRDPSFRLPFDGRYPSNAIHVDRLAGAILSLLNVKPARRTFSFAEKASTWRDVYDWHTASLGLPPVRGMPEDESCAMRESWARASIRREVAAWARGLPVNRLVRSPVMFDMALRILARTPERITKRVTDINRRIGARGTVACMLSSTGNAVARLYLSAGMPGPFLDLAPIPAGGPGSDAERARALRAWVQLFSTPRLNANEAIDRAAPRRTGRFATVGGDGAQ